MNRVPPAGMYTVMVKKAQSNIVLSQFERNSESSEITELVGVICNLFPWIKSSIVTVIRSRGSCISIIMTPV